MRSIIFGLLTYLVTFQSGVSAVLNEAPPSYLRGQGGQINNGGVSRSLQLKDDKLKQLAQSEALWKSKNIINYSYQFNSLGHNPQPSTQSSYPWSVSVQNRNNASGMDRNGNILNKSSNPHPYTMEELFQRIRLALGANVVSVEARYNTLHGFPEEIHIMYNQDPKSDYHVTAYDFVYSPLSPVVTRMGGLTELNEKEAFWRSKCIQDYGYQFNNLGPNPHNIAYPWSVKVKNGNDASGTDRNGSVLSKTANPHPYTVEELFQRVRDAYNDGVQSIQVTYDLAYGYPNMIHIQYNQDPKSDYHVTAMIYDMILTPCPAKTQTRNDALRVFSQSEARWLSNPNVLNYSYRYKSLGPNPHNIAYPWAVTVRNGNDASGTDGNGSVLNKNANPHPYTVEELFERIRNAYSAGVVSLDATFDPTYGFPNMIHIRYNQDPKSDFHVQVYDFRFI